MHNKRCAASYMKDVFVSSVSHHIKYNGVVLLSWRLFFFFLVYLYLSVCEASSFGSSSVCLNQKLLCHVSVFKNRTPCRVCTSSNHLMRFLLICQHWRHRVTGQRFGLCNERFTCNFRWAFYHHYCKVQEDSFLCFDSVAFESSAGCELVFFFGIWGGLLIKCCHSIQ